MKLITFSNGLQVNLDNVSRYTSATGPNAITFYTVDGGNVVFNPYNLNQTLALIRGFAQGAFSSINILDVGMSIPSAVQWSADGVTWSVGTAPITTNLFIQVLTPNMSSAFLMSLSNGVMPSANVTVTPTAVTTDAANAYAAVGVTCDLTILDTRSILLLRIPNALTFA